VYNLCLLKSIALLKQSSYLSEPSMLISYDKKGKYLIVSDVHIRNPFSFKHPLIARSSVSTSIDHYVHWSLHPFDTYARWAHTTAQKMKKLWTLFISTVQV